MTMLLTVTVIIVGVLCYKKLPVNDLPAVDFPVINVTVNYPGASPQTMANNVATPLEKNFLQIPGIQLINSRPGICKKFFSSGVATLFAMVSGLAPG